MKAIIKLFLLCICFILMSCGTDEPQPVEKKPAVRESAVAETSITPVEHTPTFAFPDSAYYQAGKYNDMPYQIMFPRNYDSTKTYPMVIFLHGIDERGTDNQKQLKLGASLFKSDSISRKYPSFVVFPQCPISNYWHDSPVLENLKDVIDHLVKTKSIDPGRIYIEGYSMGAYGTYAMVAKYPDLFAAAIAIAGDGDENKALQMAKVNWKIYGGAKDIIVPGEASEKMAEALRKFGANVSIKIYPDATHANVWLKAFAEPDYFSWIFSISKD